MLHRFFISIFVPVLIIIAYWCICSRENKKKLEIDRDCAEQPIFIGTTISVVEFLDIHEKFRANPVSEPTLSGIIGRICDAGIKNPIQHDILVANKAQLYILRHKLQNKTREQVEQMLQQQPLSQGLAFFIGVAFMLIIFFTGRYQAAQILQEIGNSESGTAWKRFQIVIAFLSAIALIAIFLYLYIPYFTEEKNNWITLFTPVSTAAAGIIFFYKKSIMHVLDEVWL